MLLRSALFLRKSLSLFLIDMRKFIGKEIIIKPIIAKPQTYWLTKGDHLYYNKLSNKQVYNLDFILTNGGNFEKE